MGRKKPRARDEESATALSEESVITEEKIAAPLGNKNKGWKNDDSEEEGVNVIAFSSFSAFGLLGEEDDEHEDSKDKDKDSDKEEKDESSKEEDEDLSMTFTGDSKDKTPNGEDVSSKNKNKKKTQEDEQDLDTILAELGAGPSVSKPVQDSAAEQEEAEEEGLAETAASKKKKKKKKKASVLVVGEKPEETKNEASCSKVVCGKKVPKHVREMQEMLARRNEAEERKKRQEEERMRKELEEEERLRQEEEERLAEAEEKKRLKKEKKQQGKLPSPICCRLGESSAKRPLYHKKKSKPQNQSNGATVSDSKEIQRDLDSVEELESLTAENETEVTDAIDDEEEQQEEDADEEWDAKSWDDVDLKLSGNSVIADEVESEREPLPKKDTNHTRTAKNSSDSNKKEVCNEQPIIQSGQKLLRSPICCIMGHVDSGKTKLLDCIRGTNVQEGEAGGITQQIGATYFPAENIRERTRELKADATLNVPGLLVIDTPGHESFTNLRSRGSGLCDIAILVVDIMHGLEPQTIESLNLLKMRNTHFIIALNKVDRLYEWETCPNAPLRKAIKQQSEDVMFEFKMRLTQIITQFKEQGLNSELYYKNKEWGETYNIVPTSAISGEGIPDLLLLLVQWAQKTMVKRLTYSEEVECSVLEVKVVEGHGTTIDVVLVNGVLHEGDQIVVCGMQGPVVTSIRALLTPHPMRELRVKGTYLHHKEIKAAQGIKIAAQGLEHAIAGTSLYVVRPNDDIEAIKESAMEDVNSMMSRIIEKSGEGVYVQASTLGSLEALLEFLKSPAVNIPVSAISIGPVHKKDVMKASVMLDKKKEYGTILAFDVKVTPEAHLLAHELGVKIFVADIIYHLFDQFKAYVGNLKEEKKKEAVFPCVLEIMPNCVFNKKDPILLGVHVTKGTVKIGTPICVPDREFVEIGRIASIENNHRPVDYAKKGQKVAIKIIGDNPEEQQKMFGRHFDMEDELVSKISRKSLDAIKESYADDLTTEEIQLLFKLKKRFKIP